ncbi:hypothetical protein EV648_12436 [Kribbella sp. VKM Ac-2568]|nr:hypothetical protein EV648_12436 [Kribbella sp. VKM Ac-2568]
MTAAGVERRPEADGQIVEVWLFSGDQKADDDFWGA